MQENLLEEETGKFIKAGKGRSSACLFLTLFSGMHGILTVGDE